METPISKARLRYLMPIDLIKFLKKEKVLCAFINNMTKRLNEVELAIVRYKLNNLEGINAIMCAFEWGVTTEEKRIPCFWQKIHVKWIEECNSKSKNYYE